MNTGNFGTIETMKYRNAPGEIGVSRGLAQEGSVPMHDQSIPRATAETIDTIPYGYCQCGCGGKAPLASTTHKAYGWVKGQPVRYIQNHHNRGRASCIVIDGDIAKVELFSRLKPGLFALVDAARVGIVQGYRWQISSGPNRCDYAISRQNGTAVLMHRLLTDAPAGSHVDHINHDGLDNRDNNLRICTSSQNGINRRGAVRGSQYRGVSWDKTVHKWRAAICFQGKRRYIGVFVDEEHAAIAFHEEAMRTFGEHYQPASNVVQLLERWRE